MAVPGIDDTAKIDPTFFTTSAFLINWTDDDIVVEKTAIKLVAEICDGM